MEDKIKYIIKDGEQRSRYIIGLYFPSILKIIIHTDILFCVATILLVGVI